MGHRSRGRRQVALGASAILWISLFAACGDGNGSGPSIAEIPGLDPVDEVPLVEVEPDPDSDSFLWNHAYQVGDLPTVNVGLPTPEFLEAAHRVDEDPEDLLCFGDAGGNGGCEVEDATNPSISGIGFGGPDIRAWSWSFVPDDVVAVRFTDQNGQIFWQRPLDRLVIFPDTADDNPDGRCSCRLDAINADGAVVVSVDIATGSYLDD